MPVRIISSHERDLGDFNVRRLLPYDAGGMVGPFIFFDHMGPVTFNPGTGVNVRPHPHINLATVTYLFEGKIRHRDSLGSDQLIEPGAINWMTAGRGIVHSERTPEDVLKTGGRMSGIQCWVAFPEEYEDTSPSFTHYPSSTLPEFKVGGTACKLLLGRAFGHQSPVKVHSDLFYLDAYLPKGENFTLPSDGREAGVYVVSGEVQIEGRPVHQQSLVIAETGQELSLKALQETRLMILGGKPVGKRFIYWNFVSSSQQKIEKAKEEWLQFTKSRKSLFAPIQGDDQEFIPLPEEKDPASIPRGTIM